MQQLSASLKAEGKTIGFVPTMGYLHDGHLSLIKTAHAGAQVVVVSIYVNPAQFGPSEDLSNYPRDIERDQLLCRENGVDIIFYPDDGQMYPDAYATYVDVEGLTQHLCGATRPGHFRGVTTIVNKLFNIVQPDCAVFGQKDGQQALVIKKMVKDLHIPVQIIIAPTIREKNGLALSSRNKYLTPKQRKEASVLYKALQLGEHLILDKGELKASVIIDEISKLFQNKPDFTIDYITIVDTLKVQPIEHLSGEIMLALAIYVGKARLIDNIIIQVPRDQIPEIH